MQILQYNLEDVGIELVFSAELQTIDGRIEEVDLIENGRNIPVTDENKLDYVRLIAHHRMYVHFANVYGACCIIVLI
jgi:HECT-domain (ubiquitin-transferase)